MDNPQQPKHKIATTTPLISTDILTTLQFVLEQDVIFVVPCSHAITKQELFGLAILTPKEACIDQEAGYGTEFTIFATFVGDKEIQDLVPVQGWKRSVTDENENEFPEFIDDGE